MVFEDDADRKAAVQIIEGERSTAAFAEIFGVQELESSEQQEVVKRHKDRIKRKMQRSKEVKDD